jgi:hypothetical protein
MTAIERQQVGPRLSQGLRLRADCLPRGTSRRRPGGRCHWADRADPQQNRPAAGRRRYWQKPAPVGDDLAFRHGELRRHEQGLGCLGHARQHARARLRRSAARFAALEGRDRCRRGAVRAPRRPRSLSAQSRRSTSRSPVDAVHATTEMPIAPFQALRTLMQPAWRRRRAHHHPRRENQIPIAPEAQPAPNFPRLRRRPNSEIRSRRSDRSHLLPMQR